MVFLLVALTPADHEQMEIRTVVYKTQVVGKKTVTGMTQCNAQKAKQLKWFAGGDAFAKLYSVYDVRCIPARGADEWTFKGPPAATATMRLAPSP